MNKSRNVSAMLVALTKSRNPVTSKMARECLSVGVDRANRKFQFGGFMSAVIAGDFMAAFELADFDNRFALRKMVAEADATCGSFSTELEA